MFDYYECQAVIVIHVVSVQSVQLLSDSPTINDMLTTFLDTFFSVCSKCVPTNRRHNGNYVKYPNHIAKLYAENVYAYPKESICLTACLIGGLRIMNTCWLFSGSLTIESAPYYSPAIRQHFFNM